jgi:hypothetical protein
MLSTLERYGINIYEDATSAEAARDAAEATDFGAAEPKEDLPTENSELDLTSGTLEKTIKEIVQFEDEELSEEKVEAKTKETLKQIDKIAALYLLATKQAAKLQRVPRSKKRSYLHARYALARTRVEMSRRVREFDFKLSEKKRLIKKIHQTVERVQFLEREIGKLEPASMHRKPMSKPRRART